MLRTIHDVIKEKGTKPITIETGATVYQALEKMAKHKIGALVVECKGVVVGIVSERDYARKVVLRGLSSPSTPVERIMTAIVDYISSNKTIEEGLELMARKHCRHLPVFDNDEIIGIASMGDLVKALIAERDFIFEQLANHVMSENYDKTESKIGEAVNSFKLTRDSVMENICSQKGYFLAKGLRKLLLNPDHASPNTD